MSPTGTCKHAIPACQRARTHVLRASDICQHEHRRCFNSFGLWLWVYAVICCLSQVIMNYLFVSLVAMNLAFLLFLIAILMTLLLIL